MECNIFLLIFFSLLTLAIFHVIGSGISYSLFKYKNVYLSPLIGYICLSYTSMLVFYVTTNRIHILILISIFIFSSIVYQSNKAHTRVLTKQFILHFVIFFVISIIAIQGILFKPDHEYYTFSYPLYDHCKIAIISSISNSGLPLINPFASDPYILPYYYLFYAQGALISKIFDISSYHSEIILCFSSYIVILFSIVGMYEDIFKTKITNYCLFILLLLLFSGNIIDFSEYYPVSFIPYLFNHIHGFDSFMLSLVWVPQHLISAIIFVFAIFLLNQRHYEDLNYALFIGLSIATSFGHSVYIGGFVAFISLVFISIYELTTAKEKKQKRKIFIFLSIIAFSGIILSIPFLVNNILSFSNYTKSIIGFKLYKWSKIDSVFFNVIGFFIVYYFVQYPLLYIIFLNSLSLKRIKKYIIFYICVFVSAMITLLLQTLIDNNDLGWRAVAVSMLVATILCIGEYKAMPKILKAIVFFVVPFSIINTSNFLTHCVFGYDTKFEKLSKESISAIKKYVNKDEYLLNNPDNEPLKANLVYLILTERKSCYSSIPSLKVYGNSKLLDIKGDIDNIFNGDINNDNIKTIKNIQCSKVIVNREDRNYSRDSIFEANGLKCLFKNKQIKIWTIEK